MKISFVFVVLLVFVALRDDVDALYADEYVLSVAELSLNGTFLLEFEKRTLELFADPEYRHGIKQNPFPCQPQLNAGRLPSAEPIDVHHLTPLNIQCVAAIGDSLTAALGAHAATPIGLVTEYRGSSWSVGGDYAFEEMITLPNILRKFNPKLKGFSTKSSIIFLKGQNSSNNGLNVAKSGDRSYHMIDQAKILRARLESDGICDMQNEWKMITFFVGGNDLCIFCDDYEKHSPENFLRYIKETLDYFYENFPKTFVNMVLVLDVRGVKEMNEGFVCQTLHGRTCPCAAFPDDRAATTLEKWIPQYQQRVLDLVNSGIYDQRADFTVVVQPFMAKTQLPRTLDGQPDFSYFAPDCFHFSGKGHSRSALSLWNNMLEPVGSKEWQWYLGEQLKCPNETSPYFFTRLNSPRSTEIYPH